MEKILIVALALVWLSVGLSILLLIIQGMVYECKSEKRELKKEKRDLEYHKKRMNNYM